MYPKHRATDEKSSFSEDQKVNQVLSHPFFELSPFIPALTLLLPLLSGPLLDSQYGRNYLSVSQEYSSGPKHEDISMESNFDHIQPLLTPVYATRKGG